MARIRSIKPEFWTDEKVVELSAFARLLFIGLWNFADDEGRMVCSPKRIKMQIFPSDSLDCSALLGEIRGKSLITMYVVDGQEYLQIVGFAKHQKVDKRTPSKLPPAIIIPPESPRVVPTEGIKEGIKEGNGKKPCAAPPAAPPPEAKACPEDTSLQAACRATWKAYGDAYAQRYAVDPVRNSKINGQVKQFCQRVPHDEAPAIAAFFVGHHASFYVAKGHTFGLLLSDAEKLRTEWATNRKVTAIGARQQERAGAMGDIVREIIEERGGVA